MLPYGHWCIAEYKRLLEQGKSPEDAEKIAMKANHGKWQCHMISPGSLYLLVLNL